MTMVVCYLICFFAQRLQHTMLEIVPSTLVGVCWNKTTYDVYNILECTYGFRSKKLSPNSKKDKGHYFILQIGLFTLFKGGALYIYVYAVRKLPP